MKLDVGVLFAVGVPLGLVFAGLHYAFWLRWRERALLWWASSDLLGSASVVLYLSSALRPAWAAARSTAETGLFASGFLLWLGFRRHAGQSLPLRTFAALTVIFLVVFQALRCWAPDVALLIVLASFGHGATHAGAAFDLARARLPDPLRVRALLAVVFMLHALFYLFRSATAVTVEAGADFLHTAGLQNATVLFALVVVVIWNVAALWMASERRDAVAIAASA